MQNSRSLCMIPETCGFFGPDRVQTRRCGTLPASAETVAPVRGKLPAPPDRLGRCSVKEIGLRNSAHGADKFGFTGLAAAHWNLTESPFYEHALANREAQIVEGGSLCAETGVHTGRSPKDKFVVCDEHTEKTIWWEKNGKLTPAQFDLL